MSLSSFVKFSLILAGSLVGSAAFAAEPEKSPDLNWLIVEKGMSCGLTLSVDRHGHRGSQTADVLSDADGNDVLVNMEYVRDDDAGANGPRHVRSSISQRGIEVERTYEIVREDFRYVLESRTEVQYTIHGKSGTGLALVQRDGESRYYLDGRRVSESVFAAKWDALKNDAMVDLCEGAR